MAGQPAKFKTNKELEDAIDNYFKNGVRKKKVRVKRGKDWVMEEIEVPTISGLCYSLGFCSRQSFYDYEKMKEFSYTIKRSRLLIEIEYEEMLSQGNTTGAIFALKNMGWKDKTEVDNTNHNVELELSEEEKREAINMIVERQKEFDDYK